MAGKWRGRTGTLVRANGSSAKVALHPDGYMVFRGYDGRHYLVHPDAVVPATIVNPLSCGVVKR